MLGGANESSTHALPHEGADGSMTGGVVSLLRMHKHNREWLAHCQEELVSLLHMHNYKKEGLAQCQAELVSLLRMRKFNRDWLAQRQA